MSNAIVRYGLEWDTDQYPDDASIERYMLQQGGQWTQDGQTLGLGLFEHFKNYWKLLWPDDSQTWWTDLLLKEVLENQFVSIAGPASSGKTYTIAKLALMDWSCYPDCTSVMMSSDTMDGLRNRIYGEVTKSWKLAHEIYPWFPGYPIDYKCVIAADNIDEAAARDIRNGIIGVPCKTSTGRFVGMGRWAGRKNTRVWCIGDEYQFMARSILDAQNNLIANGPNLVLGINRDPKSLEYGKPRRGYKAVFIANPNPTQPDNPSTYVSEPENGWGSIPDDGKTKVWWGKKLHDHPVKCRVINLDSLDSPNSAYPIDSPMWPAMAGPHKCRNYTEGSESYYSQGRGIFKFGLAAFKIITRELCEQFHAFESCTWKGPSPTLKIGACDAAYGNVGGDRCVVGWVEFGQCVDDKTRILFHPHWEVPITIRKDCTPEDQIAQFCREKMEENGVQPNNFFFDGRGSLAMAFARLWSPSVNAVEFGGRPTQRPVGSDIFFTDKEGLRRKKLADEHYSKFVSELWWSWHYAIESDQIRGMTMDIVNDASPREWKKVGGDKIEIESKKDMKKRTGVSPDLADFAAIAIEGARRRGFNIAKLDPNTYKPGKPDWLDRYAKSYQTMLDSRSLKSTITKSTLP